jgi:hypothetical protein
MSYGADFATADPANAPLDAPILLGADPLMAVAGVMLLLAALLLGWFLGARSRTNEGDATGSIWKAIDKAAKEAMKADDNALKGKAAHLADVVQARLGKTLALTAGEEGLARAVEDLRAALAGRKPDGRHDHDHDHDHGGDHGHEDDDHAAGHEDAHGAHGAHGHAPAASASASTGSVTIVNVIPGSPPAAPARGRPHHPPHDRKELTVKEQTAALRLAVAAFNEHWRHEDARIGAMRAALAELSGGQARGGPGLSHG